MQGAEFEAIAEQMSSSTLITGPSEHSSRQASFIGLRMAMSNGQGSPSRLEGKYAALLVCWLLGIGCLLSWNSMVTIGDYYGYLFPKYHSSRVLPLVYQTFDFIPLVILTYYEARINTRLRNLVGCSLFVVGAFMVLVLNLAIGGKGGIGTFIGICIISGAFGLGDALAHSGMTGDLSFMPPILLQSFLAGLAASGALISALRLITKAAFESSTNGLRKGALLFFAISASFSLVSLLLYASVFPKLPIVKYYRSKAAIEGSKTVIADLAAGGIHEPRMEVAKGAKDIDRLSVKQLFLQNVDYGLDLFLLHLLSLSIFPGFLFEDTGSHKLGSWYALVLIAMHNVWDLIGRYLPLLIMLKSRIGLMSASLARFLLIPCFYYTAKYGDQGWIIMLTSVLGITNGYLIVCVMTTAPEGYKGPEQNALGNILMVWLVAGIFVGVMADWLWLIGKGW